MRRPRMLLCILTAGSVLGMMWPYTVYANEHNKKYYEQQVNHFTKVIGELKAADATNVSAEDIEVIRTWIGEVQTYIINKKLEKIDPLLERMNAQAKYVQSKINRAASEYAARDAEHAVQEIENELQVLEQSINEVETRITELRNPDSIE